LCILSVGRVVEEEAVVVCWGWDVDVEVVEVDGGKKEVFAGRAAAGREALVVTEG
jgi:hypothetical protein